MATTQNLTFDLKETVTITLNAFQYDGVTPLSLVGATVNFQMKAPFANNAVVIVPAQAVVTIPGTPTNQAVIKLQPSAQTSLKAEQYSYTVQVVLSNGDVSNQLDGILTLTGNAFS